MASPLNSTYLPDKAIHAFPAVVYQSAAALANNLFSLNGVQLTSILTLFSDGILNVPQTSETYVATKIKFFQQAYWRIALAAGGFVTVKVPDGQLNSTANTPGSANIEIDGAPHTLPITGSLDEHIISRVPNSIDCNKVLMYRGGNDPAYDALTWPPAAAATHVLQIYLTATVTLYR